MGTIYEAYVHLQKSRSIISRVNKFQTKVVEKIKTHFVFNNFFSKIMPFHLIMWKNIVERGRLQMTI